jgi:hypothetical protein
MRFWELSGGVLRCPDCGRALVAVSARKGYTRKDGTRKRTSIAPVPFDAREGR